MSTSAHDVAADELRADGPDDRPEPGHEAYVRAAIAEGLDDLRAGRVTPVEHVWKELGVG